MRGAMIKVSYFEKVCHEVFDNYMSDIGFTKIFSTGNGSIYYIKDSFFINVSYSAIIPPGFTPELLVGFLVPKSEKPRHRRRMALWNAIPDSDEDKAYSLWDFRGEDELRSVLTKIKEKIIDVYGRKLLEDQNYFIKLLNEVGA